MRVTNNIITALTGNILFACASLATPEPIRIGWIGPLTGSAAVLGVDSVPAMQVAFEDINRAGGVNGRLLELVVQDDQYSTARALSAYEHMVHNEKLNVLVVLTYGAVFALGDRASRDGVVIIDPLDCDERLAALPENVFCISKMTEQLGEANARHVMASDGFPVGVIYYEADPFMGIAAESSRATFQKDGRDWAFSFPYSEGTDDFRGALLKAKQAGVRSLFFYGYDQMGGAMKSARGLGLSSRFYTLANSTALGFRELAGDSLDGAIFPNWHAPSNKLFEKFSAAFKAKVGRSPYMEICNVQSFDIARILADGARGGALGPKGRFDPARLKAFLYGLREYPGASGPITMDSDGATRSYKVILDVWKDGRPQALR